MVFVVSNKKGVRSALNLPLTQFKRKKKYVQYCFLFILYCIGLIKINIKQTTDLFALLYCWSLFSLLFFCRKPIFVSFFHNLSLKMLIYKTKKNRVKFNAKLRVCVDKRNTTYAGYKVPEAETSLKKTVRKILNYVWSDFFPSIFRRICGKTATAKIVRVFHTLNEFFSIVFSLFLNRLVC